MAQQNVRFEPNDKTSWPLSFGLGLQLVVLCIASIVIIPTLIIQAASGSPGQIQWVAGTALFICGLTSVLQAVRIGPVGSGYVLLMGTSATFTAASIMVLKDSSLAMLATLVAVSALFQFVLSFRLSFFRRIITPSVSGTVIMLIAVTIMPIAFDMFAQVPKGASAWAAPTTAIVTALVIVVIALAASGVMRLWGPVAGVLVGLVVASGFGIYDTTPIAAAAWLGLPDFAEWPGLDLSFGPNFWLLLPSFILVTLVGAIETVGDSIAIQLVSWRKPRAIDFRAVQGAITADGVGNLLSGLVGTVPNTTYSSSISVTELTGVAARRVGVCIGIILMLVALSPKLLAVLINIPGPIAGAYLLILFALLFIVGVKAVMEGGMDYRKGVIVGVAFWLGTGFQNQQIFSQQLGPWWSAFLENGMTSGGLAAILLSLLAGLLSPRSRRLEVPLNVQALPKITEFMHQFAKRKQLRPEVENKLCAVGEEALLNLVSADAREGVTSKGVEALGVAEGVAGGAGAKLTADKVARVAGRPKKLVLLARRLGTSVELEFVAAANTDNLENRISALQKTSPTSASLEREVSLKILKSLTTSLRHQQYHEVDIVTVQVDAE